MFYNRLRPVLVSIPNLKYELIFTNNQSSDSTLKEIGKLQVKDEFVHVLTFSRNFGYQASILAGMRHSRGDASIVIDMDKKFFSEVRKLNAPRPVGIRKSHPRGGLFPEEWSI